MSLIKNTILPKVCQIPCCCSVAKLCLTLHDPIGYILQTARPPCPSPSPRVCQSSCPLHQWCHPTFSTSGHSLLLLPSIFPSIKVFSNESVLCIKWPKYWSFSFSISPSNEYSGLTSFKIDLFDLLEAKGFSRVFSNTKVQKHQFFGAQPFL